MPDPALTISDVEPAPPPPVLAPDGTPPSPNVPTPPVAAPPPNPLAKIVPPPSDYHQLNTGHSTELGDSAKTIVEKVNENFERLFAMVTGTKPAPTAKPDSSTGGLTSEASGLISALNKRIAALEGGAETVAKTDFDAVVAKVTALEAAAKNAAPAVETVAKADFDALATRFTTLAKKLEIVLGLEPAPPPPPSA